TRDDAPNCKLSSLAAAFGSSTTPNHRALADARATVDVLHGLFERLGSLGVHTLEELQTFSSRVTAAQRRKRHLAQDLPHPPRGPPCSATPAPAPPTPPRPAPGGCASARPSPPPRPVPGWARWSASRRASTGSPARPRSRPRSASCA